MRNIFLAFIASLTLTLTPAHAADFQKGNVAYERGDYAAALKEWKPLAEQGHVDAQFNLGLFYMNGWGVPQDYKQALKWYRLAAEQGNANAQSNLGTMYANGAGVLQDNQMAHALYNIASANGFENAFKFRDEIAKNMSQADISIAQRIARECMASNYKNCGN
jgi:TPR repeat protein